jgi:hypothetical protein
MTLVNWYRQSQKQQLLQRVLSHSLAHIVHIYPRYALTCYSCAALCDAGVVTVPLSTCRHGSYSACSY